MKIDGVAAIVTGGGSGLGRATAEAAATGGQPRQPLAWLQGHSSLLWQRHAAAKMAAKRLLWQRHGCKSRRWPWPPRPP